MSAEKSAIQCAVFLYVMVNCSELIRYFTTLRGNALFYLKRCAEFTVLFVTWCSRALCIWNFGQKSSVVFGTGHNSWLFCVERESVLWLLTAYYWLLAWCTSGQFWLSISNAMYQKRSWRVSFFLASLLREFQRIWVDKDFDNSVFCAT
jgi:hypothetical protein